MMGDALLLMRLTGQRPMQCPLMFIRFHILINFFFGKEPPELIRILMQATMVGDSNVRRSELCALVFGFGTE